MQTPERSGPSLATPEELREILEKAKGKQPIREKKVQAVTSLPEIPTAVPGIKPLEFPTPYHLLSILRPEAKPHVWQIEELYRLGGYPNPRKDLSKQIHPTQEKPLLLNIVAVNGSGKDEYVIAPFCVWLFLCRARSRVIVTSASYEQLKYQTAPHIKYLLSQAARVFGPKLYTSVEFHFQSQIGSEIKLFVTDEPGRAEGYHPWGEGPMAIVVNEAKTVSDEIFSALTRCTGFSYWLNVSSPGLTQGYFYSRCVMSTQYPGDCEYNAPYCRTITAFDCPHIPRSQIARVLTYEPQELVQSLIYGQFIAPSTSVVITPLIWRKAQNNIPRGGVQEDMYVLGIDLAAGQDETACYLRKGARIIDSFFFKHKDTQVTVDVLHNRYGHILRSNYMAFMDDGGVGRGIIDALVRRGWTVNRILNNQAARDKKNYLNIGAELYFHTKSLLESGAIQAPRDDKLLERQITNRCYTIQGNGKFKLEEKKEHRARTGESPDRADAFCLCFYSYPLEVLSIPQEEAKNGKPLIPATEYHNPFRTINPLKTYDRNRKRQTFIVPLH